MRLLILAALTASLPMLLACDGTTDASETDDSSIRGRVLDSLKRPVLGADIVLQYDVELAVSAGFSLGGWVVIPFYLEDPGYVKVWLASFCDSDTIRVLADGEYEAGQHYFQWRGADEYGREVPDGIYWAHIIAPEVQSRLAMVYLNYGYDAFDDSSTLRSLAVSDARGRFSISSDCLPLGVSLSDILVNGDPYSRATFTRRVNVWATARGRTWAQSGWVISGERDGADVEITLD